MGLAVVSVASGGLPVVETAFGMPVTEATNGRGIAVTKVVGKPGLPVTFVNVSGALADPYFSSVKLLLGFNGVDGSTGAPGLTDESSAVQGTGTFHNQAKISTTQFKYGTSSLQLDGTTDWVTYPGTDFNLLALPFTIECWIYPTSITGGVNRFICAKWETAGILSWAFYQFNAEIWLSVSTTGSDNIAVAGGGAVTINAWNAVCLDFDGTKYRLYVNGVMVASSTTLRTFANQPALALGIGGSSNSGAFGFLGWIDELRLTRGVARYASDAGYTVATAAFPRA